MEVLQVDISNSSTDQNTVPSSAQQPRSTSSRLTHKQEPEAIAETVVGTSNALGRYAQAKKAQAQKPQS